jgi:hypothetical protein
MHGMLAACIAVMAMFLGLFALSVEPTAHDRQANMQIETIQTSANPLPPQPGY